MRVGRDPQVGRRQFGIMPTYVTLFGVLNTQCFFRITAIRPWAMNRMYSIIASRQSAQYQLWAILAFLEEGDVLDGPTGP